MSDRGKPSFSRAIATCSRYDKGTAVQLTRNAAGTVAFTIAMTLGQIWNVATPVNKPPLWKPWPPIEPFMVAYAVPFMNGYYRPILIALTGPVVLLVWQGRRSGYLVAFVLALIGAGFGVSITIFNALNQEWLAVLSAVTAVAFPAVMALGFSFQGYRSHGLETVRRDVVT
jgi:hypothetical protein